MEFKIFITALGYYTRIPCTNWVRYSDENLAASVRYLPLIGWIVGGCSAAVFYAFQLILPPSIAILLAIVAGLVLSGAFHEDGLADFFDGFCGGSSKNQVLEIMKDSSIGVFGALALLVALLLKFQLLHEMNIAAIPLVFICAHSVSRFSAVSLMYTSKYVRHADSSKVGSASVKPGIVAFLFALITALLPLLLFCDLRIFFVLCPLLFLRLLFEIYIKKRIGGYTGDCLGALQQLSELCFYISLLIIWKYI